MMELVKLNNFEYVMCWDSKAIKCRLECGEPQSLEWCGIDLDYKQNEFDLYVTKTGVCIALTGLDECGPGQPNINWEFSFNDGLVWVNNAITTTDSEVDWPVYFDLKLISISRDMSLNEVSFWNVVINKCWHLSQVLNY